MWTGTNSLIDARKTLW